MVDLDDLDLFDAPEGPRAGAAPARKCKRHEWTWAGLTPEDGEKCRWCGRLRDVALGKKNKNNRDRGLAIQRKVLAAMGLQSIPGNGPTDGRSVGENALHVAEVKSGARFNEADHRDIVKLPAMAGQLRWLVKVETPGPGRRARVVVMTVIEDWLGAFGPVEEGKG